MSQIQLLILIYMNVQVRLYPTPLLLSLFINKLSPDYVVSAASGHQRSDRRGCGHNRGYIDDRSKKLEVQKHDNANDLYPVKRDETEGKRGVLSGVRVYIGGYLAGTTDIEMKRIVSGAGGVTL